MKTFLTLVKTGLNVNFGISALKYQFTVEKRKRWEPILVGISILIGLGTLLSLYILLLNSIYAVGVQINQPEIVLTISIIFAQFIVMFFGIFYIMSTFYFSKDINILVPLPLKPYEVLGSKFIVVIVNEYLTILPMLLPAVIIYGTGTGQGLFYWLKSLIVILISPIIPLNISAIFIIILMRFINFRKSRDVLAVIGGLLGKDIPVL
jgi:ABC-2 type transport system permease protein